MADEKVLTEEMDQATEETAGAPIRLPRVLSSDISVYYSNCVMIGTSPTDISVFFGRFNPMTDGQGGNQMTEFYERHIYLNPELVESMIAVLSQTLQAWKERKGLVPMPVGEQAVGSEITQEVEGPEPEKKQKNKKVN